MLAVDCLVEAFPSVVFDIIPQPRILFVIVSVFPALFDRGTCVSCIGPPCRAVKSIYGIVLWIVFFSSQNYVKPFFKLVLSYFRMNSRSAARASGKVR